MPPEHSETDQTCDSERNLKAPLTSEQRSRDVRSEDFDSSFPSAPSDHLAVCNVNNALGLDATEIFRASLEFQQTHPPRPNPLERAVSSSSLYPSMESIFCAGGEIELERSWRDAGVATASSGRAKGSSQFTRINSSHQKQASQSAEISPNVKPRSYGISEFNTKNGTQKICNGSARMPSAARAEARAPSNGDDDQDLIAMKRAAYEGHYYNLPAQPSGRSSTPSVSQETGVHAQAFVVEENVHPADIEVGAVQAEFITHDSAAPPNFIPNSQQYASSNDFSCSTGTMEAMVVTHAEAAHATIIDSNIMEGVSEAWDCSPAAEVMVLQEQETSVHISESDRKPPAVDYSEPWLTPNLPSTPQYSHRQSDDASLAQEAQAMLVSCDIHPPDRVHSVNRETQNDHPTEATIVNYEVHPSEISCDDHLQERATGGVPENQEAQATIIDYDVHPSEMAEDAVRAELQGPRSVGVDAHYSHETAFDEYHVHTLSSPQSTGLAGIDGFSEDHSNFESSEEQEAEATVVDDNIHPSDVPYGAVHAQFVGQNFDSLPHESSGQHPFASAEASHVDENPHEAVGLEGIGFEEAAEATVISSGPIGKATPEAWSAEPASEARVMEESHSPALEFDSKPPSVGNTRGDTFAMADGEAEVVDVVEEIHPSEFIGNAAEAELIGSDDNCAIAVPSGQHHGLNLFGGQEIIEEATYLVEGPSDSYSEGTHPIHIAQAEAHEAQATLIGNDDTTTLNESGVHAQTHSVTAVLQESYLESDASGMDQSATPVTVMEGGIVSDHTDHGMTAKADPLSNRSVSAPSSSYTRNPRDELSLGTRASSCNTRTTFDAYDGQTIVENIPPVPPPVPVTATTSGTGRSSWGSVRSESSNGPSVGLQSISSNICRGTNNVMEMLFGNSKPASRRRAPAGFDSDSMAGSILPRSPLPSSVIYSEATNSWVATVNTNQKALECNNVEESSKALRAFSVPTKKQAMALARAWAPPRMLPFDSNQRCFICETQFAVFRRACHCRNCGIVVCGSCIVQWPSKMLPATYNSKKEAFVKICKGCDWLCSAFRLALLHGEHDKAVALYSTGNVNLTTPFANVKGELFYPVHCAVLGGNLGLLRWLVDEHCCPLRSIRISHGKEKDSSGSYTPILTSKGRSLLGIALSNRNIGIVRYLVAEKRMLLSAEKGLSVDTLVQNLDLVLRVLPEEVLGEQDLDSNDAAMQLKYQDWEGSLDDSETIIQEESVSEHEYSDINARRQMTDGDMSDSEECIICCSNPINCVATPCGHQICCLECSRNISRCPVCAAECSFMRVFRA